MEGIGQMLDLFCGDEYILRHLVYAVVERVVAVVIPELNVGGGAAAAAAAAEEGKGKGVAELLMERGIAGINDIHE